jgi:hypothetical protein
MEIPTRTEQYLRTRVDEGVMELRALNRRYAEEPWLEPATAERSHAEIERLLRQAVTLLAKHADKKNTPGG